MQTTIIFIQCKIRAPSKLYPYIFVSLFCIYSFEGGKNPSQGWNKLGSRDTTQWVLLFLINYSSDILMIRKLKMIKGLVHASVLWLTETCSGALMCFANKYTRLHISFKGLWHLWSEEPLRTGHGHWPILLTSNIQHWKCANTLYRELWLIFHFFPSGLIFSQLFTLPL